MLFPLFFLLLLSGTSAWSQENSEYLRALESEASGLTLDKKARPAPNSSTQKSADTAVTKDWDKNKSGAIADLLPGLSIEQFEQVLQHNYMGSFLFYKRLSDSLKNEVFSFYQENPDSGMIREKILQLSKK